MSLGNMMVALGLFGFACGGAAQTQTGTGQASVAQDSCAATSAGLASSIVSPDGMYRVVVHVVMAGRDSVEVLSKKGGPAVITFVAGVLDLYWLPGSDGVAYSVSPIYDPPGIFVRRMGSSRPTVVVAPTIYNTANPEGADFMRLCGVEEVDSTTWLRYARFGDVDKIDFNDPPKPLIQRIRVRVGG